MNYRTPALALSSLGLLLALAACGDRVETTETPQSPQANVEINRQGMEGAKSEPVAQGVQHDTAAMGAAPDPRSAENEDTRIAASVQAALLSSPDFGALGIEVASKDGTVTLRGRAPDATAKDRATEIARGVAGVKKVDNKLTLG